MGDDWKCQECGQEGNSRLYCKPCNTVHCCDNLHAGQVEYSNLENIVLIAHGGFESVYKAIRKNGLILVAGISTGLNRDGRSSTAAIRIHRVIHDPYNENMPLLINSKMASFTICCQGFYSAENELKHQILMVLDIDVRSDKQ
ncbi:kinase-like domain-containing protein [Rhizophagus clarus]|uniref:Kinase-like domain-containing protein n=1 Tax=Rhizophagus clarus TaxID=94130 RepID=A0A8H3M375_9GLOM|nr:kinase-like domain-containing protein [Rhizophagus clarus]